MESAVALTVLPAVPIAISGLRPGGQGAKMCAEPDSDFDDEAAAAAEETAALAVASTPLPMSGFRPGGQGAETCGSDEMAAAAEEVAATSDAALAAPFESPPISGLRSGGRVRLPVCAPTRALSGSLRRRLSKQQKGAAQRVRHQRSGSSTAEAGCVCVGTRDVGRVSAVDGGTSAGHDPMAGTLGDAQLTGLSPGPVYRRCILGAPCGWRRRC